MQGLAFCRYIASSLLHISNGDIPKEILPSANDPFIPKIVHIQSFSSSEINHFYIQSSLDQQGLLVFLN